MTRRLAGLAPAHALLIAVSAAYCAMVAWRTSQSMGPTFDEVIYASQVARDVPASMFTAPRAWGMPILLAPVAVITPEILAIRIYLVLLAGLLLYVAFRPWLKLFGEAGGRYVFVPALAAGLLASLWVTILYGTLAYPNLWLAFVLVAGAGYYFRALTEPTAGWRPLIGVVIALGAASLIRPTDALAAAGPLLVAPLVVPRWRRLKPIAAMVAGLAIGWVPWIVEAYVRFEGPWQRLQAGARGSKGGWVFMLPGYLEALDGPALQCNPPSLCAGIEPTAAIWWLALPLLVAAGLLAVARRHGWLSVGTALTASALAAAVPYIFLLGIAQPRYLLPTYALLAVPVAACLLWLMGPGTGRMRLVALAAVSALLVGHVVVQQRIFDITNDRLEDAVSSGDIQAEFLRETVGVGPPCLFWGEGAIAGGYLMRCQSRWRRKEVPAEDDPFIAEALERGETVIVRLPAKTRVPPFMAGWRRVALPGAGAYAAYIYPPDPKASR